MLVYEGPRAEEAQETWYHCPLPTKHPVHAGVSLLAALWTLSVSEILHTATIANFLKSIFDHITPLTNLPWLTSSKE